MLSNLRFADRETEKAFASWYVSFAMKPTAMSIKFILVFYASFAFLDYYAFPISRELVWLIRGLTVGFIGLALIWFEKFVTNVKAFNAIIVLISFFLSLGVIAMIHFSEETEVGKYFYFIALIFMFIWMGAFLNVHLLRYLFLSFALLLIYVIVIGFFGKMNLNTSIAIFFSIGGIMFGGGYNYNVLVVRRTLFLTQKKLKEQNEAIKRELIDTQYNKSFLDKEKERLNEKIKELIKNIPEAHRKEILSLINQKQGESGQGRHEELQKKIFTEKQIKTLIHKFGLNEDQIKFLSGLSIGMSYEEIRETFFPHLSIRTVENMPTTLRRTFGLNRGGNLIEFLTTL
ncbi:MAG: hypothetical protein JXR03_14100 [Cyclobacteriaceae bacterium]